jgi:Flp pilus assembly protein TadD
LEQIYKSHPRAARRQAAIIGPAVSLAVAAATFLAAFDGGSYSLVARSTIAVLALWCLAVPVALGLWPRERIPAPAIATALLLASFALWTALSIIWSASAERSYTEFVRVVLFLAVFLLAVLSASRRLGARHWIRGLALGITAVAALSLASRLFPDAFRNVPHATLAQLFPPAEDRLSYPLQYWNALGTLLALAVPLLLYSATTEARAVARGIAVLPLPAFAAAIYLASSRGAVVTAGLAVVVFVGLTGDRWRALGALVVAGAGSAAAVAFTAGQDAVIEGPLATGANEQGHRVAAAVALACIGSAVVYGAISSLSVPLGRARRPLGFGFLALAVVAAGVAIAVAHPAERFDRFKSVPHGEATTRLQQHLLSGSGNGRWQLWSSAVDEFRAHPVVGDGAGSYEAWWARTGSLPLFVRDAHSLYLETLGELGVVGLALLLGALLVPFVVGIVRALRSKRETRAACAALAALLAAYLFEAGVDWMWEMTVVTLVAVVSLGLLTGAATLSGDAQAAPRWEAPRWARYSARAAAAAVVVAFVVAEGIPLVAQASIDRSQDAVRRGDLSAAESAASIAARVQPWASSPWLQKALVQERQGDIPAALDSIHAGLERNSDDWRLWLTAARIETRAGRYRLAAISLRTATRLNPRSRTIPG